MMTDKKKVSFQTASKYNGIEYKTGRINISPTTLEEFGIDEDNPEILVKYDNANNQIVIMAAPT